MLKTMNVRMINEIDVVNKSFNLKQSFVTFIRLKKSFVSIVESQEISIFISIAAEVSIVAEIINERLSQQFFSIIAEIENQFQTSSFIDNRTHEKNKRRIDIDFQFIDELITYTKKTITTSTNHDSVYRKIVKKTFSR